MIKNNIIIENARIGFRNFSGKEGKFNPAGKRNFCVFLESDIAASLEADGWNVRWLDPKDEYEEKQGYMSVAVSYDNIPPRITIVTGKGKSLLDDETVSMLDWVEIATDEQVIDGKRVYLPLVDLAIRPYNWKMHENTKNEKSGVKAYIKTMRVVIVEDEFEAKYNDAPANAHDAIGGCGNCEACDGSCNHDHD